LSATGSVNGNNLIAQAANAYIGGSYGTLAVNGAMGNTAGGATALYVGSTGTLGQLRNSGTISGNVVNMSANVLTIAGAPGAVGSLPAAQSPVRGPMSSSLRVRSALAMRFR
jgi:hypothetical protein